MRPVLTLSRMISQALESQEPTDDYIRKFCDRAADKLYVYDQTGTTTSQDMFATLYYAKHILGVTVVVIDSLMKLQDVTEESFR
jgi:hypothetical protein